MRAYGPEFAMWIWVAIVAVSIVAAVLVRLSPRHRLATLTPHHVAAAAIVGMLTWFLLLQVPSLIMTVLAMYAGIERAPNQTVHQLYAAAQIATVVAGVVAVVGLLRRGAWAVPLAAGVCLASIGGSVTSAIGLVASIGEFGGPYPDYLWFVVSTALQPIPAIVGLVLLAWPFLRGTSGPMLVAAQAGARTSTRDGGIVDAGSDEAVGIEWPDLGPPAEDRR